MVKDMKDNAQKKNKEPKPPYTSNKDFNRLPDGARLNLEDVCYLYDCSRNTLFDKIDHGQCPEPHKDGRYNYWLWGEVQAALSQGLPIPLSSATCQDNQPTLA